MEQQFLHQCDVHFNFAAFNLFRTSHTQPLDLEQSELFPTGLTSNVALVSVL